MWTYESLATSNTHLNIKNATLSLTSQQINIRRNEIYHALNGDAFFPMHTWPLDI